MHDLKHEEFEELLSDITSRLAGSPVAHTSGQIQKGLDSLRASLGVERATLFRRVENSNEFRLVASSISNQTGSTVTLLNMESSAWAMKKLVQGEAVLVENVNQLSKEALADKEPLRSRALMSFAAVPISTDRSVIGAFTLTDLKHLKWPRDLVRQLGILGNIFYQALTRQKLERKARAAEKRLNWAVEGAPVMIWMCSKDNLCTYVNRGWLAFSGHTAEQALRERWPQAVHPDDAERVLAEVSSAMKSKAKMNLIYRMRHFDGEYRWVLDRAVAKFNSVGEFDGYVGSCVDITEIKRSELELKDLTTLLIDVQEQERRRLARNLHDDFSQELTLLAIEVAKLNAHPNQDPIKAVVNSLEARIKRLASAANRQGHELYSSYLETLGLVPAIRGFCTEFSEQHGIQVDFRHDGIPSYLPHQVSLCVLRVVQEALQSMAEQCRSQHCSIDLSLKNDGLVLHIAGQGAGLAVAPCAFAHSTGIIGIRERLRLVDGSIQVVPSSEGGVSLEVRVPLDACWRPDRDFAVRFPVASVSSHPAEASGNPARPGHCPDGSIGRHKRKACN